MTGKTALHSWRLLLLEGILVRRTILESDSRQLSKPQMGRLTQHNRATARTQVGIIGAGPADLLIGNLLLQAGIDCIIVERHSRDYIERRARAGLIEHWVVEFLQRYRLADRLLREGKSHAGCELRYRGQCFRIPYSSLYGGRTHYVYPQQELVKDLVAAFLQAGGDLRFATPALGVTASKYDNSNVSRCSMGESIWLAMLPISSPLLVARE
jgi:2-polyprenyl-6-methoxyphenol hydroxylase-like FAD-dependent oxidoreductase